MPIPELNVDGLLPSGIHECTLDEIDDRFAVVTISDRRLHLMRRLLALVGELRQAGIARYLIVDGSFVTAKEEPGDIDLLLVFRDGFQIVEGTTVPPFHYNLQSRGYIRKHFGFDCFFGWEGDDTALETVLYFQGVKGEPHKEKGLLRVGL